MKRLRMSITGFALILLSTAPAYSGYSIPVSSTAQGGGTGSNQTHHLTFIAGQSSPVVKASNTTHSLSSGFVSVLLDVSPPAILHSPPAAAVPDRTSLEVTADIGDDRSGVESATVFYREGGSGTYRQRAMSRDGSSFSASLPPSAVTERGLLYYIEAADSAGNRSRYPAGAPESLVDVRVWFEDLESAFEMPAGQYRMISLPGSTGGNPDEVLVDDLGAYDSKVWRLGRWNQSIACSADCYDEYPDLTDMDRGRAFWLISKTAARFDFSGLSTLPESPFRLHLEEGWNQIGTPFAFATDWLSTEVLLNGETYPLNEEHFVGADTIYVEDNLVSYDGAYHGHESTMEPWLGYWLYNGSTREVDLLIKPHGSIPAIAASPVPRGEFDAIMELRVSSPDFPERTGLIGLSPAARDGWDPLDHREPPAFGDYLRLVFEKPMWGDHRGTYMTDIRHSSEDGAHWEIRIDASMPTSATLGVHRAGRIPQAWDVFLYDEARGLRLAAGDLPYRFELDGNRDFSLIAGTTEFINRQENEAGMALRAQIVAVAPNPFRQSVDIAYFTPEITAIEMDIFSVAGRLIKTVTAIGPDSGISRITWNGDSDRSGAVAPGLYFVRLKTGRTTHTTKILKIQ